jgi:rhodanese-related sulfurtransferase
MRILSRKELKEKMQRAELLTLVEVLSLESFNKFHLPGAINVPLNGNFNDRIQQAVPDKNQQVVVYCKNSECTASLDAAKKWSSLGTVMCWTMKQAKKIGRALDFLS